MHIDLFMQRWQGVTASELATAQSFVMDLCDLLGVGKPHPTPEQDYMFERPLKEANLDGSVTPRQPQPADAQAWPTTLPEQI